MGVSAYVSISTHSTKSWGRIATHFPSSWTYSMLLDLPGYIQKLIWNMHTTSYTLQRGTNQQFINDILGNLLDICVIGYIDNILIYSNSLDKHKDHVQDVLWWLQDAGLYANPKKCTFHMDTMEYLGFILSPEGLHMDPAKVSMIQSWPEPHNICKVQSFLGFTNFYQCFISHYVEFTQPLTNLCWKNTPWHFGESESTAFQCLKTV